MSNTKELYKRVWQTAFERQSVELAYPTKKEATRMRLNLYSGVQKYRKDYTLDPEFSAILEQMEITEHTRETPEGETFVVRIALCTLNPLLQEAASQLGLMIEADANEAAESQSRLASLLEAQKKSDDPYGGDFE